MNDLVPPRGLGGELLTSLRREPVVAGPAIVLRRAPEGGNPATIFEPMQRRVERPVFDLEHHLGAMGDDMGNRVAVGRTHRQGLQDEQVERALEQLALEWRVSSAWQCFRR